MFEAKVCELESQGARVLQQAGEIVPERLKFSALRDFQARLAQSEMEDRFRSERAEQQSQEQSHRQLTVLGCKGFASLMC